jgi:hypothetical protein
MPSVKLESAIETELVQRVRAIGGVAEKVTVQGSRGYFDRVVVLPGGMVVFVEVKRPKGGVVAAHQQMRAERYRLLGAVVALVKDSGDIDQLIGVFERAHKRKARAGADDCGGPDIKAPTLTRRDHDP